MYGLIDISSSKWSRRRIAKSLRRLIVMACRNQVVMKRSQLENSACDLVQRAGSTQRIAEDQDRLVIDWLLSTLEIGHAIIALRELIPDINNPYLFKLLLASLEAIANLHETPSEVLRMKAVMAIDHAINNLSSDMTTDIVMSEAAYEHSRKALSMLHFIHSALLDEESVLVAKEKS